MSTHIGAKMKEKNVVTIYLFHVNLTIALYRQVDMFPKLYQVFLFYILWRTCDSTLSGFRKMPGNEAMIRSKCRLPAAGRL